MADTQRHLICSIEEIDLPGSKEFSLKHGKQIVEGFVVRHKGGVSVYKNQCPHTGASLNWQPDQFLSFDNAFIQCSIHGAMFQMQDGLCIHGPCLGQNLEKIQFDEDSGRIFVDLSLI